MQYRSNSLQTELEQSHALKKCQVELTVKVWNKQSHSLFDYKANQGECTSQKFDLSHSVHIMRKEKGMCIEKGHNKNQGGSVRQVVDESAIRVGSLIIKKDKQPIFEPEPNNSNVGIEAHDPSRTAYMVLGSQKDHNPSDGFAIKPGNIFRIGRIEYLVIEISDGQGHRSCKSPNIFSNNNVYMFSPSKQAGSENEMCRICFCEEENPQNPLISPCLCKGSLNKIHLQCLKTWISHKIVKQIGETVSSYNYSKFECEICKWPFPEKVYSSHQEEMMTISRPDRPYLIIESIKPTEFHISPQHKQSKYVHVISPLGEAPITLGRAFQADIRVQDITVSRFHAEIHYRNNRFRLFDCCSKFGTLVKIDSTLALQRNLCTKVQFGRFLYEIKLSKSTVEEVDTE